MGVSRASAVAPARVALRIKLRNALRKWGILRDPGAWIDPVGQVFICAYPRRTRDLERLQSLGIHQLINLRSHAHRPGRLAPHGLVEHHIPVPDFHAPTPAQLDAAVAIIKAAVAAGERIVLHCGAGLGRAGTVAACYLVAMGQDAAAAIQNVRSVRPGAVETEEQVAAVVDFSDRR